MGIKILPSFVILFLLCSAIAVDLSAQEESSEELSTESLTQTIDIFSITVLLDKIKTENAKIWTPDFPAEIPPDAFYAAGASSITFSNGSIELTMAYNSDGKLVKFPFFSGDNLCQVNCTYDKNRIATLGVTTSEQTTAVEFIKYDKAGTPELARVNNNDTWYFVSFNNNAFLETWADEDGTLLAAYVIKKSGALITSIESYGNYKSLTNTYYDSFGNITKIECQRGTFKAVFNDKGLQYWEHSQNDITKAYYFQWDENKHLIRMYDAKENETESKVENKIESDVANELEHEDEMEYASGGEDDFESASEDETVYEYEFDEMGNWTERREVIMQTQFNMTTAKSMTACKRVIEYPVDANSLEMGKN
ncbi:MAG: hypothetical protein Ta2B_12310 [Termitinemataceae bacterium]|nr:MAG: hypothetical protein Ta2B_12310 [Termitinemataceae bacterium]